jgi:hypothetical protein
MRCAVHIIPSKVYIIYSKLNILCTRTVSHCTMHAYHLSRYHGPPGRGKRESDRPAFSMQQ